MRIYRLAAGSIPKLPATACCIGYFDGFHRGHRELMEKTFEIAKQKGLKTGLITFDPDPWTIFQPEANLDHITSLADREKLAQAAGFDEFYVIQFTRAFAALSPDEFHALLERMNVKALICGYDFHYAVKNSGDIATLQKQSAFPVYVVDAVEEGARKISSTRIEQLIRQGRVYEADSLLGYMYSIPGTIVKGFQRGRLLHYPTANLQPEPGYIMPEAGVYFGYAVGDFGCWPAMINVGRNLTFAAKKVTIEAYLFGLSADLYGHEARYFFASRLRDVKKFEGLLQLKSQLDKDAERCRRMNPEFQDELAATRRVWGPFFQPPLKKLAPFAENESAGAKGQRTGEPL